MGILEMMKKNSLAGYLLFIMFLSLVLSFSLVCSSEPLGNRTWEFYGKSKGGGSYYYSKINNVKSSDVTSVWSYKTITDIERKEKIKSMLKHKLEESVEYENYSYNISRIEINCKKKLNRVLESISYDDKGNILDYDTYNGEWQNIKPQSMSEKLYQKSCPTKDKPPIKMPHYKNNWA